MGTSGFWEELRRSKMADRNLGAEIVDGINEIQQFKKGKLALRTHMLAIGMAVDKVFVLAEKNKEELMVRQTRPSNVATRTSTQPGSFPHSASHTPFQGFSWLRVRTPDCWEKSSCPSTLIPSNTMLGSMAGLMVPDTLLNVISPRRSS